MVTYRNSNITLMFPNSMLTFIIIVQIFSKFATDCLHSFILHVRCSIQVTFHQFFSKFKENKFTALSDRTLLQSKDV